MVAKDRVATIWFALEDATVAVGDDDSDNDRGNNMMAMAKKMAANIHQMHTVLQFL